MAELADAQDLKSRAPHALKPLKPLILLGFQRFQYLIFRYIPHCIPPNVSGMHELMLYTHLAGVAE